MTGRGTREPGAELHLGRSRRSWRDLLVAARRLLGEPRGIASVLGARLTGRRLRARQRLAALIGIDHALALPAAILDRYPPAGASTLPDDVVILGDAELVAGAEVRIRKAFAEHPDLQALYGDALVQDRAGAPVLPLLPPTFDPVLLAAVDYLAVLACRRSALDSAGTILSATDAAFRVAERYGERAIGHLPEILSVRRVRDPGTDTTRHLSPSAGTGAVPDRVAVLRGHLDRTGHEASRIEVDPAGLVRVLHPLPAVPPLASVIVPTRDRLDLLRTCLDSLREFTDWPALEFLVCDNDSREPETLSYLAALQIEGRAAIVPCPGPFNFAAMNDAAAARARGRLLVFVNNDVAAFRPDWLSLMAREALRPDVGAVGAKLLDGAGRIQHGGIVFGTGGGLVTHGHRHFPGDAPGYLSRLRATHAVSAVTAACLVVEADKFRSVGGFDEKNFAVDFNDVDLCLRLDAAGYRTLLVPGAVLHHREAASRRWNPEARARHEREIAALRERWGPLLAQDPHYHPGFDPELSTHARLRAGFPAVEPASVRRPRA